MNIIGLGLDAAEIHRVERLLTEHGERFTHRVFTEGEIAYCSKKAHQAESYAARFAAKEAGMKALGTGHAFGVLWKDVEVVRHNGPPRLHFHGRAAERFAQMGGTAALVTITHTRDLALAHVILMGVEPQPDPPPYA